MSRCGSGILVVDKPEGPTSHDMVGVVRRALGTRRVGHCGTLDPLATGVLVICVGSLTRLSDWLTSGDKEYEARFYLGATSNTDDAQGVISPVEPGPEPSTQRVGAAMERFVGVVDQVPPAHSAVRVDGVRSYHRARRNQPVALSPRPVRIDRFDLVEYRYPHLEVRVVCGKGTYVRSLARDLGSALGCGGYVERLRRLRVGPLTVADAVAPERLAPSTDGATPFVDAHHALEGILEFVEFDDDAARVFGHGGAVPCERTQTGDCAVFTGGRLLGVGRVTEEGLLRPVKVFAEPSPVV